MNISAYNLVGHAYLLSRPYIYDGGLFGQMLTSLYVTDTSTSFNFSLNPIISITSHINSFFFNNTFKVPTFNNFTISYNSITPTNLTTSVVGIIFLIFLFLNSFVVGIIWTCLQFCKYNVSCIWYKQKLKHFCYSNPNISKDIMFHSKEKLKQKKEQSFNKILIYCIISFCLFIACLISFILSLTSQVYLQQQLSDTTTNSSFSSSCKLFLNQLDTFLNKMINESYNIFNASIGEMTVTLQNTLFKSINKLIVDLLYSSGINTTFVSASNLIQNLQNVTTAMQYVLNNTNDILSQINYQAGSCQAIINLLAESILRVCNTLPSNSDCYNFLNVSKQFLVIINPNIINSDSSVTMLFLLNQLKLNATSMSLQFSTMESNFNNDIILETNKKVETLNLQNSLNKIRLVWPFISKSINPISNNLTSFESSLFYYLNVFFLVMFITVSILFVILGISILLYILALFRYSFLYYLQKQLLMNLTKGLQDDNLFIIKNFGTKLKIRKLEHSYKVSNIVIYSYIIITSFVITLIFIFSLVLINGSHFMYNEACIQIWRWEGLSVSDNFLDNFLNNSWDSIISYILSKNPPIKFTFLKPTKVLTNLRNNCTKNTGIFAALRMNNFLNISSFLWTPSNMKSLLDGLNITYSLLFGINISKVIPINTIQVLNSTILFSGYFDNINYKPRINELSKGVIELKNYSSWITSAINYFSVINSRDSNETILLLNYLKADLPQIQKLELSVINLKNNFQKIQDGRTLTLNINALLSNIALLVDRFSNSSSMYSATEKAYTQRMLTEFTFNAELYLNILTDSMIKKLFPCNNLVLAMNIMLNNLCNSDATLEKMNSYGLNIAIFSCLFMFMIHFLWIVVRIDIYCKKENNISIC